MSASTGTGKRKAPQHPLPERAITRHFVQNELRESDTKEQRNLLRDAIMAMYRGGSYGWRQAAEYGWSEQFVRHKVKLMPDGLMANNERLDLLRSASDLAGVRYNNAFTETELQECLLEAASTSQIITHIFRKFGVGKSTFYRYYKMLPPNIKQLTLDQQRAAVYALAKLHKGPKPYLTPDEAKFILATAGAQKRMGNGFTVPTLTAKIADIIHTSAKDMSPNDPVREERLRTAPVSVKFTKTLIEKHGPDVGISTKTAKTSKKSHKRAEVCFKHESIALRTLKDLFFMGTYARSTEQANCLQKHRASKLSFSRSTEQANCHSQSCPRFGVCTFSSERSSNPHSQPKLQARQEQQHINK